MSRSRPDRDRFWRAVTAAALALIVLFVTLGLILAASRR